MNGDFVLGLLFGLAIAMTLAGILDLYLFSRACFLASRGYTPVRRLHFPMIKSSVYWSWMKQDQEYEFFEAVRRERRIAELQALNVPLPPDLATPKSDTPGYKLGSFAE